MNVKKTPYRCILCGTKQTGWGNNPEPLAGLHEGRCCDDCNRDKVIPARLGRLVQGMDIGKDREYDGQFPGEPSDGS
jgi:hypothetical protein